jgi:hypothetical protein
MPPVSHLLPHQQQQANQIAHLGGLNEFHIHNGNRNDDIPLRRLQSSQIYRNTEAKYMTLASIMLMMYLIIHIMPSTPLLYHYIILHSLHQYLSNHHQIHYHRLLKHVSEIF